MTGTIRTARRARVKSTADRVPRPPTILCNFRWAGSPATAMMMPQAIRGRNGRRIRRHEPSRRANRPRRINISSARWRSTRSCWNKNDCEVMTSLILLHGWRICTGQPDEAGRCRVTVSVSSCGLFYSLALGHSDLNHLPDQAPCPFDEGKFIREAAFQKHADTVVPGGICRRHQSHVFPNAKMRQMYELGQYEQAFGNRRLNFIHFLAKVLQKDFLKSSTEFHGLFPDNFEALVQLGQNALRNERARLQGLFDIGVLCDMTEFIVDFRSFFGCFP